MKMTIFVFFGLFSSAFAGMHSPRDNVDLANTQQCGTQGCAKGTDNTALLMTKINVSKMAPQVDLTQRQHTDLVKAELKATSIEDAAAGQTGATGGSSGAELAEYHADWQYMGPAPSPSPPAWIPYAEMTASQSSTYTVGAANKCLTNSPRTSWPGTCTHTQLDPKSWWKVTLRSPVDVKQVKLTNRVGCCPYRLQSVSLLVDSKSCGGLVHVGSGATSTIPCVATGREVKVQHTSKRYLTICGFGLYAARSGPRGGKAPAPTPTILTPANAVASCPREHPYAYHTNNAYCCKTNKEKVHTASGAACDGSVMEAGGVHSMCCENDDYVRCPTPPCSNYQGPCSCNSEGLFCSHKDTSPEDWCFLAEGRAKTQCRLPTGTVVDSNWAYCESGRQNICEVPECSCRGPVYYWEGKPWCLLTQDGRNSRCRLRGWTVCQNWEYCDTGYVACPGI